MSQRSYEVEKRWYGTEPRRVPQLPAPQAAPDCPACANHWCHVHNPLLPPYDAAPLQLVSDPRELWRVPLDFAGASTIRDERAEREQAAFERELERGR